MPTTEDGLLRMLDFFLYGMLRAAETLGNPELFLRTVEELGLRKFMAINMPTFQAADSVLAACQAYTRTLDEQGLIDTTDTKIRGDDESVHIEIGPKCLYRRTCTWRHDDGLPVHCIRAYGLAEMLRIRLESDYDWSLEHFGLPCRIRFSKTSWR